jgi:hypothetical protein
MKKIPSLFKRDYEKTRMVYNEVVPGSEWVLAGEGRPTEKFDGTSCALLQVGEKRLYVKRYTLQPGKKRPKYWIPTGDPDENTGKQTGWVPVGCSDADMWHVEGLVSLEAFVFDNPTFELVGPKVQGNPYGLTVHDLWRHGMDREDGLGDPRTFEEIRTYLSRAEIEGIVWHHDDGRMVKIKRRDFGFEWPVKK